MTKTRPASDGVKRKRGAGGDGSQPVYTRAIEDKYCNPLAAGEGLATICKDPDMPSEQAVRLWVMDDRPPGIALRYARARTIGYHHLADEIIQLSDDPAISTAPTSRALWCRSVGWPLTAENGCCRVLPKIYGDKIEVTGDSDALGRHQN